MTKRRKAKTRTLHETTGGEFSPPDIPSSHGAKSEEELERRMQSALADVYEALADANGERDENAWSKLELVNDLIH